jgi:hypothetical protein
LSDLVFVYWGEFHGGQGLRFQDSQDDQVCEIPFTLL